MVYAEAYYLKLWVKSKPVHKMPSQDYTTSLPITNGLSQVWSITNTSFKLSQLIDHTGSVHARSALGTCLITGRMYLPNESFWINDTTILSLSVSNNLKQTIIATCNTNVIILFRFRRFNKGITTGEKHFDRRKCLLETITAQNSG